MASINFRDIHTWPKVARYFIFGLIFFAVLYLGYLWHLSNLITEIENTKKQEIDLKAQLERSIDKASAMNKELMQYPQLKTKEALWEKTIVAHADLAKVFNDILKIGADNQLNFVNFDPEKDQQSIFYHATPIKVVAVASYHQLASFLSQLGSLPVTVVVKDFNISSENKTEVLGEQLAKQANNQNLLSAEILLIIYHQPSIEKPSHAE